jgi:uncharacterized protein YhaN
MSRQDSCSPSRIGVLPPPASSSPGLNPPTSESTTDRLGALRMNGTDRTGMTERHGRGLLATLVLTASIGFVSLAAASTGQDSKNEKANASSLEETRLRMGKWIETQQIISKERKEWQQGKEILLGRVELLKQEIAALQEKITQAEASTAEVAKKREELLAQKDQLSASGERLTQAVSAMEGELRRMQNSIPEPTRARVQLLYQRMPEDPASTKVTVAERFQNVLGIQNELNKANTEINVSYEVRTLADGKPAEVKTIYVGLGQAYYVSARGEAGIGRPTPEGWQWEPAPSIAPQVLKALEIVQGKQTPAFVPLPVKVQ